MPMQQQSGSPLQINICAMILEKRLTKHESENTFLLMRRGLNSIDQIEQMINIC